MKKTLYYLLIAISFLFSIQASQTNAELSERTPQAASFQINYSHLADNFHWMDQVSESCLSFFQIPDYKAYWINQWTLTEKELSLLRQYQTIRKKYQNEPKFNEFLSYLAFAPDPAEVKDPIADAFYTSLTLNNALKKLHAVLTSDESIFIKAFFEHFEPRLNEVTWINSYHFPILKTLNTHLDSEKVLEHLNKMQSFYRSKPLALRSILLFSAPEKHLSGACYGDHLHLRLSKETDLDKSNNDVLLSSVLVHEATHHISGSALQNQKANLSAIFLESSGKPSEILLMDLEEPLVVASQMYFIKNSFPELYQTASEWFFFPLAEHYFSILEAYLESAKPIDDEFIKNCAMLHKNLSENKNDKE